MKRKVEVPITGTLFGFAEEGQSEAEAQALIILEAEQRINNVGDIRAHIYYDHEQEREAQIER